MAVKFIPRHSNVKLNVFILVTTQHIYHDEGVKYCYFVLRAESYATECDKNNFNVVLFIQIDAKQKYN